MTGLRLLSVLRCRIDVKLIFDITFRTQPPLMTPPPRAWPTPLAASLGRGAIPRFSDSHYRVSEKPDARDTADTFQ